MTNWSWASLRLLGTAGVNNVPPARLCAGTGLQRVSPYKRLLAIRRERAFSSGVGDVPEPGIWEIFTFLGVGICWSWS